MRYPRAYFVFDYQEKLPSDDYFKSLGNSTSSPYLLGVSKPIKSLQKEIDLILEIDSYIGSCQNKPREVLVLSYPKVFDFLMAYFGDKNLDLYWIDNQDAYERTFIAYDAIEELDCMDSFLYDASIAYSNACSRFYHLVKRTPHPHDDILDTIQAISMGEVKTVLESELRVLLKSLLSINVLNRFDL